MISAFTNLVQSIISLVTVLGPLWTIIFVAIVLIYFRLSNSAKNKNEKYYFEKMIKEKNNEIERLAEDNNDFRKIYLKQLYGLSSEQYEKLAADDIVRKEA